MTVDWGSGFSALLRPGHPTNEDLSPGPQVFVVIGVS
jgi:hypothetical protein